MAAKYYDIHSTSSTSAAAEVEEEKDDLEQRGREGDGLM